MCEKPVSLYDDTVIPVPVQVHEFVSGDPPNRAKAEECGAPDTDEIPEP